MQNRGLRITTCVEDALAHGHDRAAGIPDVVDDQDTAFVEQRIGRELQEDRLFQRVLLARIEHHRGDEDVAQVQALADDARRHHPAACDDQHHVIRRRQSVGQPDRQILDLRPRQVLSVHSLRSHPV